MTMKNITPTDLPDFTEKAYLNYSMYVILDRALPSIKDGLKPVQRRILYAMNDLSLSHTAKYKKSARTIGDVLGKYHPHGDSACYEAMVNMAQPFNYRYPLVDGQGNWGSQDDPNSFAAMRYTESRLTAYSSTLLTELKQGTTDFIPNFDGTTLEPTALPTQIPNILLNSATGIAVGMATEIPPHRLEDVVNATVHLLEKPKATVEELLDYIPAPDFPSGGYVVSSKENIRNIYETGRGAVRVRAKYHIEGKNEMVVTELPYKVKGEKLIEEIADLMQKKKLPMVEDIRDESDHSNPIRLVLVLKKNSKISFERFADHLFKITKLEINRPVNMNMIGLNGKPQVKSLKTILLEWITYRQETVRRKLNFRLGKIADRLDIIETLLIAYLNIDEVIEIIRGSDNPKEALMARFELSEIQANAILDTKLRNLARLEEVELNSEKEKLEKEADGLRLTLSSERRLNTLIKKEMNAIVKDYGDERRSEVVDLKEPVQISADDLLPSDPVTVVISAKGWIRSGKGHQLNPESLQYKAGDAFLAAYHGESNKDTILLDSAGKSYSITNSGLPTAKSMGAPVSTMVMPAASATFIDIFSGSSKEKRLVFSKDGYGFICNSEEFFTRQKKGKVILTCTPGNAMPTEVIKDEDSVAVLTKSGHLLIFALEELPVLKKGKGNKLIGLANGDTVVSMAPFKDGDSLLIKGTGKEERWTPAKCYPFEGTRGRKGGKVPKTFGELESISVSK